MDSSPYSTLQTCLLLCQVGVGGGVGETKGKKPNSKQPKECQNDKQLSRRGSRDTLPVSVLTQQEWSLG